MTIRSLLDHKSAEFANEPSAAAEAAYPRLRMRRTRQADWSRRLVAEHRLSSDDLIWPVFVHEGPREVVPVPAMPGVDRIPLDQLAKVVETAVSLRLPAIALFPAVDSALKSEDAKEATNPNNLVCRAVRAVKKAAPNLGVICDVALDPYTPHGHDGLLKAGEIVNDETVAVLCKQAVALAESGADIVAPSDMMDGRVGAIRDSLETQGFKSVKILAYAAKYASALYGPFRHAVNY